MTAIPLVAFTRNDPSATMTVEEPQHDSCDTDWCWWQQP